MNFAIYDDKLRPPPAPRAKRTAPRKSAMSAAPLRDRTNREATAAAKAEEEAAEEAQRLLEEEEETAAAAKAEEEAAEEAQRLLEEEEETAAAAKAEEEAAEEAHRLLEEEEEEAKAAAMAAAAQQGVAGAAAEEAKEKAAKFDHAIALAQASLEHSRKLAEEEKEAEAAAAEAKAAAAEQEKEAQRLVDLAQQRAHIKAAERQQAVEELACGVDDVSAKFEDLALLVQACSISVGLPPPAAAAGAAAGPAVEAMASLTVVGMAGTERPKKSGCSAAEAAAVGRLNRDLACVRNVLRVLKHNQDLERRSHCRAGGGGSGAQHVSDQAAAAATAENQDPAKVDKITAIQKELEDTAAVLHKTIDGVLERGVKLDQLVANAHDLSKYSKMGSGYKQAKKTNNSCCVIV